MAIATSSTLTQEFVDILSQEMLLAPDPQFVFAALAGAARAEALGVAEVQGRSGVSGPAAAMAQGMGTIDRMNGVVGAGFVKAIAEAAGPGKVIQIDRPVYLAAGTMTETSRRLTEGTRVSGTPLGPTMQQVTLTVREYGGPHDGSAVVPVAITEFLKRRAKHDLVEYIGTQLRRDRNGFCDRTIVDLLLTTTNQTIGNGGAGGGTTAGMTAAGNKLKDSDLAIVKRKLLERNIPTFPNGRYMLALGPRHEEDLRADANFREIVRYQQGKDNALFTGYLGSYAGFDVVLSNNVPTVGVGAGGAVTGYQAAAFGPGCIGWGIGMDVEARRSKDDDFAREDRYLWLAHEAWGLLDAAFVEKIVTS